MPRFKHPGLADVYREVLVNEHGLTLDRATQVVRVAGPFSEQALEWAEFLRNFSVRHDLEGQLFLMLVEAQQKRKKRRRLFAVLRQCGARLLPLGVTAYELPWILDGAIEALRSPA